MIQLHVVFFPSESIELNHKGHRKIDSARPCGEGVYGIVEHGGHTHLAYVLEIPELPGEVQNEFHIDKQGSFVISIKNPSKTSPTYPGIKNKAKYPEHLQAQFQGRHFIPLYSSSFLDFPGSEILLIGASTDLQHVSNQADQGLYSF